MNKHVSRVFGYANEVLAAVESWCRVHDKKTNATIQLSDINQLKLLRLRTWSLRYHLSISDILDMVLPVVRWKAGTNKKTKHYGLGVTMGTLTGPGAERILKEEIVKRYPNGEHIKIWKAKEQEHQLQVEHQDEMDGMPVRHAAVFSIINEGASVENFIGAYKRRAQTARADFERNLHSKGRRRPYRGNPWI
jgi:hypothetical protein